eukprot:tig00000042_g15556.t1
MNAFVCPAPAARQATSSGVQLSSVVAPTRPQPSRSAARAARRTFVGEAVRSSVSFTAIKAVPLVHTTAPQPLPVISADGRPSWLDWPWPGEGELAPQISIPLRDNEDPEITHALMWDIINDEKPEISDRFVNALLGYCLGYRYVDGAWSVEGVLPPFNTDFVSPPDFIGCRPPMVKLTRSTPEQGKQLLKDELKFEGYKIGELFPRKTRRATAVNWLMAYDKFIRK